MIVKKFQIINRLAGGTSIPDFKKYYRSIAIKTTWYCHQNTSISNIELRTQIQFDPLTATWLSTKRPNIYIGEKISSIYGIG